MDGNGNKVQTLRHQFEARHVSPHESQRQDALSGVLNASATTMQLQQNDPRYRLTAENNLMPSISAKSISLSYGSGGNSHPVSVLSELGSQPSRSGVYVSNSITLYDDLQPATLRQEFLPQNEEFLDDSSSQNSSALYGKVKRRNAFRKKDGTEENVIDIPRSREKLSLERVRSLEDPPRRIQDIDINRARSVYVKRQNPEEDPSGAARLNPAPPPQRAIRTVSDYVLTSQKDSFPYSYSSRGSYNSDVPPPVPPPPSFYEPYWRQARNVSSTERPLSIMSDSQHLQIYSDAPREPPPPEKPPRTFLYDMFTDQVLQPTDVYSKDYKGTSAVAMNRRGTLPTTGITSPNQYSSSAADHQQIYGLVPSILNLNISPTSTSAASGSSKRSNSHPGLTRSKTESEIIVKPKPKSSGQSIAVTGNENQLNANAPPFYPSSHGYPVALDDSRITNRPNVILHDRRRAATNRQGYYGDIYGGSDVSADAFQNTSRHTQIQQHVPHYGKVVPTNDYSARATAMQTAGQSYSMLPRFPESAIPLPVSQKRDTLPIMPSHYGVGNGNRRAYIDPRHHRQEERLHAKSKSDWALNNTVNDERNYRTVLTTGGNINAVKGVRSAQKLHRSHQTTSQPCFPSAYQYGQQKLSNKPYAPTIKEATASTDSGIQLGSDSLCSCDTPLGDSTTDTGDSDPENEEISYTARQVVEARKGYIRHVSSFRKDVGQAPVRILPQTKKTPRIVDRLFECLVVVGLNRDANTGSYKPYVKELYPPEIELPSGIEQFCFPDATDWPCYEGETAQSYTLAITDHYGRRKYGYCCRILPEGANICIPITYCLISTHRAIGFYMLILKEITKRHGNSESLRRSWIDQLYNNIFPPPDGEVQVKEPIEEDVYGSRSRGALISSANTLRTISMRRRADNRLDDSDLVSLLTQLDVATVLKIFGSILHERKVVLLGRALKTLSLCIEALESMLHPFTWQHTFIPLLPLNMPDILDAPSPFLIGVLKMQDTVWDKRLDDGMIVDIDANKIVQCVGDEATILPKRIHRKLKDSLQCILTLPGQDSSSKNVLFSECFIRMFVDVLGHYGQHIVMQADGSKMFDRDSFLKATDSKAIQNFLDWFSETSMFHDFIESRLSSNAKPGVFERRIMGDQSKQSYGAPFKNKTYRSHKTFGINWLKDTFILK